MMYLQYTWTRGDTVGIEQSDAAITGTELKAYTRT